MDAILHPRLVLIFLCLSGATVLAQPQDYVALVTDVNGGVVVIRASDGARSSALWGTQLLDGDHVNTLADGAVSILFSNQNLITLGANSSMTIATGISPREADAPARTVDSALLASVSDLTLRRTSEGGFAALGGLRAGLRDQQIELLAPRNTKITAKRPHFSWQTQKAFESYQLKILSSEGLVWSGSTPDKTLFYPEDAPPLDPGTQYIWSVEADDLLDTVTSPSAAFELLSDEALADLAEGEDTIKEMFGEHARGSDYRFLLGSLYVKNGLLNAAIDVFSQIAEEHSEAALPYEILGKLYSDIGLKDHAIEALQHAISLGK
jgi:hypothetical protein